MKDHLLKTRDVISAVLDLVIPVLIVISLLTAIWSMGYIGIITHIHEQAKECPAEQSDPPPRWEHTLPYRP